MFLLCGLCFVCLGLWLGFKVVVVAATVFSLFSGGRCDSGFWCLSLISVWD
jgi:hypothetical protein